MMTRRSALMAATAAAAMGIGAPANAATAPAPAPTPMLGPAPQLPRHKVQLVSPPFAHAHEQVGRHGPRIIEFTITIEEKAIVIDADGHEVPGDDLQRLDAGAADGRA